MESRVHKSALLTSSTKSDVLRSGGVVSITDLVKFKAGDMLAAEHLVQRDEVRQLVTIDLSAVGFVLAASKTYTILAGNTRNSESGGGTSSLRKYSYTSPADITGLTDQVIVTALVKRINDQPNNFLVAVDSGGLVFTIQDDAGYYPARPGTRVGPTQYKLVDGLVSGTGATIVITTAGVVGYGVGQRILDDKPVIDKMTGNLVAGEWDYPENKDAVAGQKYDGFYITYGVDAAHNAVAGLHAKKILRQLVWVDNGKGTSVTNLAGWKAFRREFERLIYGQYAKEPSAIVEFWERTALLFDKDGIGVPTGGVAAENIIQIGDNQFRYAEVGATSIATDPIGSDLTNGFNIDRGTPTSLEGLEVSAEIGALATQEFTVGKQECSFFVELEIADVSDTDDLAIGFRKKAAYTAAVDDYTDMAAFNIISGDIKLETILNSAATTTTDTTNNWLDTEVHTLEVRVDLDGKVTYRLDDKAPITVAAFTFDATDVIIPFIYHRNVGGASNNMFIKKWYSVPAVLSRGV